VNAPAGSKFKSNGLTTITGVDALSLKIHHVMVTLALLARLEAKPGKEKELAELITGAVELARAEPATVQWFALRIGPTTFGIFDTFEQEEGRMAHLNGPIAAALMAKAPELLAQPPVIEKVDLLAVK
jgi:quinol monooxygenase YgiN